MEKSDSQPEVVFKRFHYGAWRTWPHVEQAAVERMLQAVWETVRSNPPIESGYIDVDQWLCWISQCEDTTSGLIWINGWRTNVSLPVGLCRR